MSEVSGALYGAEHPGATPERYLKAWHLFIAADGELTPVGGARVAIGVTHAGRVRVSMPEGLDLAPAAAARLAARVAEAAVIARDPDALFAPDAPIADTDGDTAECWVPELDPNAVRIKADVLLPAPEARRFAARVLTRATESEAALVARNPEARFAPGDAQ